MDCTCNADLLARKLNALAGVPIRFFVLPLLVGLVALEALR